MLNVSKGDTNMSFWFSRFDTYLFLLLIEIVYNDTNEEIECEEGSKYDENNKI